MVTTSYSTTPAQRGDVWTRSAGDATPQQLHSLIAHHREKLAHPHPRAGIRAKQRSEAAIAAYEAELARRKIEGPQLRALPCTYRVFDRWNTVKYPLVAIYEAQAQARRKMFRLVE